MSESGPDKSAKDAREERLKQALRANLKRRKQQSRLKQQKDPKPETPKAD
ncbi:MAG: hypothetical protein AAGI06_06135 [Pseudomonadota bacterium]